MTRKLPTYLDVLKATLVGPEVVNQVSIGFALHRLGVGRGDGVALAAYDGEDQRVLPHALRSRQLGFARLVGLGDHPAAGSESFVLVRADRSRIEPSFHRFSRPPFVFWRVGGEAVLLPTIDNEVLRPRVEPDELARFVGEAKGVNGFYFRLPPSSFIDSVIAEQFERSLRRVGARGVGSGHERGVGQRENHLVGAGRLGSTDPDSTVEDEAERIAGVEADRP